MGPLPRGSRKIGRRGSAAPNPRELLANRDRVLRALEDPVGRLAAQHEADLLEAGLAREVRARLLEQHLRAALRREAADPGADRGHRDRAAAALARECEAATRARAHRMLGRAPAGRHPRGVDHVPRGQRSRAGDRGVADLDRADRVALLLDRRPAALADRAGHAGAELERAVRRVHDRIHRLLGDVALDERDATAQRSWPSGRELAGNSASSTSSHSTWMIAMWVSWIRGVWSEGTTIGTSTQPASLPPPRPARPIVAIPRWRATATASSTLRE